MRAARQLLRGTKRVSAVFKGFCSFGPSQATHNFNCFPSTLVSTRNHAIRAFSSASSHFDEQQLAESVDMNLVTVADYPKLVVTVCPHLSKKQPEVLPEAVQILKTILEGKEPDNWDWQIRIGDGTMMDFYVHGKVLTYSALIFLKAIQNNEPIVEASIEINPDDQSCILPGTSIEDMKVILSYFYLRTYEEPRFDRFRPVYNLLKTLLPADEMEKFLKYWEVAMLKRLIQKEKEGAKDLVPECGRILTAIRALPEHSLPVAEKSAEEILLERGESYAVADSLYYQL